MKRKFLFQSVSIAILICLLSWYLLFRVFEINKNHVFLCYSIQEDISNNSWAKFKYLFPEDFNPYIANTEMNRKEILKLNTVQRELYDSIQNSIHPFKTIVKNDFLVKYSIRVSPKSEVNFEVLSQKEIRYSKAKEIKYITVDSLLSLIPDVYISLAPEDNHKKRKISYNLVVLDSVRESAWLLEVNPNYIEYE